MKELSILYHGTCRAFLAYALENKGLFGPEDGETSFTLDLDHAICFAEQWSNKKCNSKSLEKYFGKDIDKHLEEPIILEITTKDLDFNYRDDCGKREYFLPHALNLNYVKQIYFKEGIKELKQKYKL
jgi:hypothetical protein